MVEPSPPALQLLFRASNVGMAKVGVKVKQEEFGRVGRANISPEPAKKSPLHGWSGNQQLEARQLTPPVSRSPSVRIWHFRDMEYMYIWSFNRNYALFHSGLMEVHVHRRALQLKNCLTGKAF